MYFSDSFAQLWPVAAALSILPVVTVVASSRGEPTEVSGFGKHAERSSRISTGLLLAGVIALISSAFLEASFALMMSSVLLWSGAILRIRVQEVSRRSAA